MAQFINTITTYQVLLQDDVSKVFIEILNFSKDNYNQLKKVEFERFIEDFCVSKKVSKKVLETLDLNNLLRHGIVNELMRRDEHYISFVKHVKEMFNNISKETFYPLSYSNYQNYEKLIANYLEDFRSMTVSSTSDAYKEKKNTFINYLLEIEDSVSSSFKALEEKKDRLNDDVDITNTNDKLNKLKKVQELRKNNITPLRTFLNQKSSNFIKSLNDISELFKNKKKYDEVESIDNFIQDFTYLSKRMIPIAEYITSFINQQSLDLYLNLAVEKKMTELQKIVTEESVGNQNKIYIYVNPKIFEIPHFFDNAVYYKKDENINTLNYTKEDHRYYINAYITEEKQNKTLRLKNELRKNINYKLIQEAEEEKRINNKFNTTLLTAFVSYKNKNIYSLIQDKMSVVEFILKFFEEFEQWHHGHFHFIYSYFIKNIQETKTYTIEKDYTKPIIIEKNGIRKQTISLYIKENNAHQ